MADELERNENDLAHRDPITGAPGSHPVGTGVGAAAGGVAAGAAVGAVAGPVGAVVGAAIGAVVGGLAGKAIEFCSNRLDTAALQHISRFVRSLNAAMLKSVQDREAVTWTMP